MPLLSLVMVLYFRFALDDALERKFEGRIHY